MPNSLVPFKSDVSVMECFKVVNYNLKIRAFFLFAHHGIGHVLGNLRTGDPLACLFL